MKHKEFYIIKKKNKWFKSSFLIIMIILFFSFIFISINLADNTIEIKEDLADEIPDCDCPRDNNLPIMVIDTNNKVIESNTEFKNIIINKTEREVRERSLKYDGSIKLYEPNRYGYTCICDLSEPTLVTNITINTRGQSSLSHPKKQYTIAFKDEKGLENHLEILGMPKHDKWVLNGSYGDKSLIRNYLAYKMAGQVMEYAPRTRYVEVYLNETGDKNISFEKHYIGVYLLVEKIERGINRVDIDKNEGEYKDVSFIIARDKIKYGDTVLTTDWGLLEEDIIIDEYGNVRYKTVISVLYPGKSKLTKDYENDIKEYINKFEYNLKSSNFNSSKNGYRDYIDVDSFVNFAMINEIFKNIDGGDVSTFFYKGIGEKMKAGPIWDFDLTLGNTSVAQVNDPTGFRMVNTLWFDRLFQDAFFANRYSKILYPYYRSKMWKTNKIMDMIDEAVNELGSAVNRNSNRWYKDYGKLEYEIEIKNIKNFLEKRLRWMDDNIYLVKRIEENVIE